MRSLLPLCALLALPLAACDSSSDAPPVPQDCSLNVSTAAQSVAMRYTYTVSKTGTAATVSALSYRSAEAVAGSPGITSVASTTLPWTITVTLPAGTAPLLSVSGTVTKGKLVALVDGRSSETTSQVTVTNSRECVQY